MNDPLFSIIIPTHGRSAMLMECLASVMSQSLERWECHVVSDLRDEFSEIRDLVAKIKCPKIFFHENPKPGANASRNLGLTKSKGKWIAWLDDDDLWHPEKLSRHLQAHQEAEFVWSGVAYRYQNRHTYDLVKDVQVPENPRDRLEKLLWCPVSSSCVSVSKNCAATALWDENLGSFQDWDYWRAVFPRASGIKHVPLPLAVIREHEGHRTSKNLDKRLEALAHLEKKLVGQLEPKWVDERRRHEIAMYLQGLAAEKGVLSGFCKVMTSYASDARLRPVGLLKAIRAGLQPNPDELWLLSLRKALYQFTGKTFQVFLPPSMEKLLVEAQTDR